MFEASFMAVSSRKTRLLFSKGNRVEVFPEKVENCEVWFPAVVEEETGNGSFLVEYQCLGKNGVPESVKVKVDFLHIRPSPPQFVKNYDLLEKVDAYIDFGWWSGVLTKKLPDSKYLVFFKQTKKERLVNQSEIRPHMEWKEGNWFGASQDLLKSPDYQGPARNVHQTAMVLPGGLSALKENSAGRAANFFNSLDIRNERLTPSNIEPSTAMKSQRKKTKLLSPNTDEQTKMMKQANISDLPHLSTDHLNSSQVGTLGEEIQFGCATLTDGSTRTINSEQSMVDLLLDNHSRTTRRKRARSKVKRYKPGELESTPDSLRWNAGRPPKLPSEIQALAGDKRVGELGKRAPEPSLKNNEMLPIAQSSGRETFGDKNNDDVRCTEENFIEGGCVTEVPVTRNVECEVIEGSQSKKHPQIPPEELVELSGDREQQLHDAAVDGTKEADQPEGREESIGKRKRGRPPKNMVKSPEVSQENVGKKLAKSPEISRRNGGVAAADMALEAVLPVVLGLKAAGVHGSVSNKGRLGVDKRILNGSADPKSKLSSKIEVYPVEKDKLQSRKVVQASVKHHEKDSSERGRRPSTRTNPEIPIQDPKGASVGKIADANKKDSLVKEAETSLPLNLSDDQPLSMWLGSPKAAKTTCASQGMNVELCTANRSPKDIVMLSPQSNDESLPFAKSSPLWKTIEAMEVFRQLPQRPHFQSLGSRKESLAIALMVDFAGVVDKASTLQFDGPRRIIEDNLENLIELENNGFDVKVIRDRLSRLLSIKDKQEELQGRSKKTKDQIKEINYDRVKIDEKIEEIDNQIRLLQEERALVLSTKEEKDSTIASLEVTVEGINSSIKNANLEFEALVAAPWQVA